MSDSSSVTHWIGQLHHQDQQAGQRLWEKYIENLIRIARNKLGSAPRQIADEEDVVVSAFDSFLRGVQQGRFNRLEDRHDLWQILVMLTERKAIDQRRRELSQKRGAGKVVGESVFLKKIAGDSSLGGIGQVPGHEPTPEFTALVTEEFERLLSVLEEEELKEIALAKLEGHTNQEIAEQRNITLRTIERRLALIRRLWEKETDCD